eukprot:gnl/MRDRNA2_/MRDRNA2_78808_c0_seq1.p1 gnl/MRDRNA2_/MRDRNA2_78808_c0~~gnl/MRDRNA2_/MRDRNA2_78808_c0_seq1.p1  ORF type:complete len:285 (+),score=53.84 gnl/MRDRNA2_/MRDRNA2_78808_c0_seq1:84-857(+)
MPGPKVWRRVVLLKWKPDADRGAIARAFNLHRSFINIPAVLSVSEGFTFTSGKDGGGAYAGEDNVNRGFDSAIELIISCSTPEELKEKFWDHPVHMAAGAAIGTLIADKWAMDWVEDRDDLVVPSATTSHVKHIVFFRFESGTTQIQKDAILKGWRSMPAQMPGLINLSCGEPVHWERGEKYGYSAGVVANIAMQKDSSGDGIAELNWYHTHEAFTKVRTEFLAPIMSKNHGIGIPENFVVMDFIEHRPGLGLTAKL